MPAIRIAACALLAAAALTAGAAQAQTFSATPASAGVPQPHLLAARKLAEQDNFWKSAILTACYPDAAAQPITRDPAPTKAMDNLYYVGTGSVSAWAINTSDGIILIDSLNNQAEADKFIIGGLQTLGLDPTRIKAIIISHAHADHFGGAGYLQARYGAKVYMSAEDWAYLPDWLKGPYAKGRIPPILPKQDFALKDGQSVTVGDVTVKMFLTPGHTPGALSLLIPLKYKGQPHTFVFEGGVSSDNNLTPAAHAGYDAAIDRLIAATAAAHADGVMANHGSFDDVARKAQLIKARPNDPNPFIVGPDATLRWLRIAKECNLNNRDIDAAMDRGAKRAR